MAIYKVYKSFAYFSSFKRFNSLVFTWRLIKSILLGYLDPKMSITLSHNQGIYISMNTYK